MDAEAWGRCIEGLARPHTSSVGGGVDDVRGGHDEVVGAPVFLYASDDVKEVALGEGNEMEQRRRAEEDGVARDRARTSSAGNAGFGLSWLSSIESL